MFRLARVFVCVLLAAATVQAQRDITTSLVKVRITGPHCDELHKVLLVIDDLDDITRSKELTKVTDETCFWSTDLGEAGTYSTKLSHFSLRVDLGRTDCHQAYPNETKRTGELEFACCIEGPVRDLRVKTEPAMPVSYLRIVPKDPGAPESEHRRTRAIDCTETSFFPRGTGSISYAQFPAETIYLQLGAPKPQRKAHGLDLKEIVVDGHTVILRRDGVVYRLIVQRGQGRDGSSPTLSSNAISIDVKKLSELKLESVEFTAIK